MRRERRGGDADAEAPQAFKEGARTLQNEQKGTRSVVLRRRVGGYGVGIDCHCWGQVT
jgi:predicted pyridoxine 5'-phosphate oxidase superfamily flavin-nucleotide-binding protein